MTVNLLRFKALITGATICSNILFIGQKFSRITAMFYRIGGYRANFQKRRPLLQPKKERFDGFSM
ncbi:uncharacterized protein Bfra_007392 [Botrytis fragariae]|uniref:Uncharacterized protein n=1 Tax=Botrytis fragariae TaxID=1964551 RepID=A0A8H6AIB7_9HELO|nr:uncharacterized protein Bfra_007392 [Botrytis fragariae]KAF5868196.1 hypothetical protein Bfra_007392 [Botrytis fragariae]